ncbi:MAG TPA: hypothetical protein DCR93_20655 [Cytophagales bacterium]|nr:hypothetical protein [Cytophagales bacterium]HAP61804.1 hypothetical protein [Cytophagales bacterium]
MALRFKLSVLFLFALVIFLPGCSSSSDNEKESLDDVTLRLQWIPQAQFAGYIVADELEYYKEEGLNVTLLPAGPDLKPHITVANGSEDIGIGVPNQILTARSNEVPLTIVAQVFQDSPNRYILKAANQINSLQQLAGKKVGLWLGGDEAEFIAMLRSQGMALEDVDLVSQGFSVIPFLEEEYILSQVTTYNELNQIKAQGYSEDDLQIISPEDYKAAIPGDVIFVRQDFIETKLETLVSFLSASMKGWQYAIDNPDSTIDLILRVNPELDRADQESQLREVIKLVTYGNAQKSGLGVMTQEDYERTLKILRESNQIEGDVDITSVFDPSPLQKSKSSGQ